MADAVNRSVNIYINEADLKASFDRLSDQAVRLEEKIRKAGSPESQQKLSAELDKVRGKMDTLSQQIDGKLNPSLNQLKRATNKAFAELNNLPIGTPEWKAKLEEFEKLNTQLIRVRETTGTVGRVMETFGSKLKTIALGTLIGNTLESALEKLTGYFTSAITGAGKLSDELADIQKTTGLTADEVQHLNAQLGKIDTRTATTELRKIAIVAGQLGISAREDVLAFVTSIDKLAVALGDEFSGGAEQISDEVGRLRNVLGDMKSDNISADLLRIGNALNAVAADGSATAPVMTDFANRIGGVGITLGLTSGQVFGLSATLQELNVSTERGGTAISKILQKMTQDTDTFGRVAGAKTKGELKAFKDLVNTDLYAAFLQVIKGSKSSGESATALAGIIKELEVSGAGASEVFAKLGENTALLEKRTNQATSSLKGTSSIMDEYAIKNENTAAKIEKLDKAFAKLASSRTIVQAVNAGIDVLAKLAGVLTNLPKLIEKHGAMLIMLGSIYLAYTLRVSGSVAAMAAETAGLYINNAATKALSIAKGIYIGFENACIVVWEIAAGRMTIATAASNAYTASIGALSAMLALPVIAIGALVAGLKVYSDNTEKAILLEKERKDLQLDLATAMKSVDTAMKGINEQLKKYNELSEEQRDNLREKVSLQLQKVKAQISETEVKRAYLAINAIEATVFQKYINASISAVTLGGQKALAERNEADAVKNKNDALADSEEGYNKLLATRSELERIQKDTLSAEQLYAQAIKISTQTTEGLQAKLDLLTKAKNAAVVGSKTYIFILKEMLAVQEELKKAAGEAAETEKQRLARELKEKREHKEHVRSLELTSYQNLLKEIEKLRMEAELAMMDDDEREITRVKIKYDKLIRENAVFFKQVQQLEILQYQELLALTDKQFNDRTMKEYNASLVFGDEINKMMLLKVKERYAEELIAAGSNQDEIQAATKRYIAANQGLEIAAKEQKVLIAKDYIEGVKQLGPEYKDYVKKLEADLLQYTIDAENAKLDAKIQSADKQVEIAQARSDKEKALIFDSAQAILGIFTAFSDFKTQRDQLELEKLKKRDDDDKNRFKKLLDSKKISQGRYDREIAAIDKKAEEREKAAKISAFKRNKILTVSSLLVQGVQAALTAYSSQLIPGDPTSPIRAAIAAGVTGALYATQIALAAAQPAPQFAKGGLITDGPSHSQGGMGLYSRGKKVAELEGGETVLSKDTTRNNRRLIDALLYSSMYGGGRAITPDFIAKAPRFNYGGVIPMLTEVRRYETGGTIAKPGDFDNTEVGLSNATLGLILEAVSRPTKAYVVANEMTDTQASVELAKSRRGLK